MRLFPALLLTIPLLAQGDVPRIRDGLATLDRLYWSPTLGIWLDRPGDDLRAHYEGRRNPPWWSSANAVELLLDFMAATGTSDHEKQIATLYALNQNHRGKTARVIAELRQRGQWSDADEAEYQKRRAQSEAAEKLRALNPAATARQYYVDFRNEYLDDSGWWALAWLKMYDRTHDTKYLATARAIHAHMAAAWRPDKSGGVLWCEEADKQVPNAITNGLFLILSARLHARTGEPAYLTWAAQTDAWRRDHQLYDGIAVVDAPGHRGDYWTYNQGVYLGGLTALYEATGQTAYLGEAAAAADTIIARSGVVTPDGIIIEKLGTKGWDVGLFKGVFARYLAQLRDLLRACGLHAESAARIDHVLRQTAASIAARGVAENGEYRIEWHPGGSDATHNFNTHTAALCALVAALPPR
jgi:predicted alpha-1,6-mannanase (GH76 family)